jgi:Icc-related predicted phosphoesterase
MIIDCISDLHGFYPELEGGDLLIIAGDILRSGESLIELLDFEKEYLRFKKNKYKKIILVAGNHDCILQEEKDYGYTWPYCSYLCDSGTEFEGLKIWGSPWTLSFKGLNPACAAFTGAEDEIVKKFELIPDDTDILITHGPPIHTFDYSDIYQESVGSKSLYKRVCEIKPKLHVFGHIHEAYGQGARLWYPHEEGGRKTIFVNAAHCNEYYQPVNKPIRIVL